MTLTVREAATVLNVSETKIYRWVDDEVIPFVMVHHHPRFHRLELLEWAMEMELPVSFDLYADVHDQPLTRALERGGGRVIDTDLAELASQLPLEPADRDVVRSVITAREAELFVNAGEIAIPKARSPIICADSSAAVSLSWSGQRALFLIVAPTIKRHLQLLSRLSLAVRDSRVRTAVQRTGAFEPVVVETRRWEQDIEARTGATG